jgi:PAS domain S-box-containing protein
MAINFLKEKIPPIFYILVVFSIAISLGAYINYRDEVKHIKIQKKNELTAITNLKAKQIGSWRMERLHDAQIIKGNSFLIEPLLKLNDSKESLIIKSEIKQWLKPMVINNNYKDIVVIDSNNNFLMSVSGLPYNLTKIDSENINTAKKINDICLTDLYLKEANTIKIDLVVPISTKKGSNKLFAFVIIKIDPFTDLYPLIQSWPTLSKTSETLIVEKSDGGDSVLFLSELKFKQNSALNFKISINDTAVPAVKAVLGREGIYEAVDYRGEKVLAESKKIPNTNWFMITKTDLDELYEPLAQKTKWFVLFIILIVLLTFTFSWQIWVSQKNKDLKILYQSQIETKAAEKKFQVFFENSSSGKSLTEVNGKVNVNSAFAEMLGYSKIELEEINWQSLTHPDDVKESNNMIKLLIENKIPKAQYEKRYIHKNGSNIWALLNTSLQSDEKGNPLYFLTSIIDITEKKNIEKALIDSEKWLKESQIASRIGSYNLNIYTNIWSSSIVLDEIFGIDESAEKTVASWNGIIHPNHQEEMLTYFMEEVIGKKQTFNKEYQIVRPNDRATRWVWGRGELSFDENGNPMNMVGTIQDITERKIIEEALKNSEERYRGLFDNIEAGIVVHAPDTSIRMSNAKASILLGLSSDQMKGKLAIDPRWKFLYENNEPLPYEEYPVNKVASTKEPIYNMVYGVFRLETNDTVWLIVNAFPVFHKNGEISEILISFIDISERKILENNIIESEEKYRKLFTEMTTGFALCKIINDDNGNAVDFLYVEANPAFEKFSDLAVADTVGKRVKEVIPDIEQSWIDNYGITANEGKPMHFENYLEALDKYFEIYCYCPKPGFFAVNFTDVSERHKASKKVHSLNHELELKNIELEQLIYIASHDFRSPLVNIQGFNGELKQSHKIIIDILEQDDDFSIIREKITKYLETDFKESIDYIDLSAEKISKLISGLLKVSRLSRTEIKTNEINIKKLTNNIVSTFEFLIKSNKIKIKIGELPNCYGDELMLDQLFSNLIGNAIKFISKDRASIITISGEVTNNQIVYCIEDNGIGFSTEYLDKIFLLFHRLDSKTEGEGLGLAIVKKIIDKHNGNAWAESTQNKGSKFFISIPNKKINL